MSNVRCSIFLLFFLSLQTNGASVRTFDGKTYEGEVKLEQSAQISVITTEGAKPLKLNLSDILQVTFGGEATKPKTKPRKPTPEAASTPTIKEGLMLRSGTLLAATQIEKADNTTIIFLKSGRRETVPFASVARIIFRDLGPDLASKIPEKQTGVLLKEGDFVEGEFRGMVRGRVQLSSVLFGLTSFDIRDKAVALILSDLEPARPQMLIHTHDGSTYVAKSIAPDKDLIIIQDAIGQQFTVNRWDISEINAGTAKIESLTELKPTKSDPDSLTINKTAAGLSTTLAGTLCEKGLTQTAGSSATWDLAGKYRTLTFKCGVPQNILPTAPVRFIVLADGKEVYKSHPRTSQDEPQAASLNIKDIKTLTLKIESTTSDPIPTPGLWADIGLVK